MNFALSVLSAWKTFLTTTGLPHFTSSLLKYLSLQKVLSDHHLSHSFSPYLIYFSSEPFFSHYMTYVCLLIIGLSHPMRASEVQGLVCWAQPIPAVFWVWLGTQSVLNSYGKKHTAFPKILRICPQLLENDIPQAVATPRVGQEAATECPPGLGQKAAVPYHREPLEEEEPGTTCQL